MFKHLFLVAILTLVLNYESHATPEENLTSTTTDKIEYKKHSFTVNAVYSFYNPSYFESIDPQIFEYDIFNKKNRFNFGYQYFINPNFFIEAMLMYDKFTSVVDVNKDLVFNPYPIDLVEKTFLNFNIGGGYRILKNNKQLLDIHVGLNGITNFGFYSSLSGIIFTNVNGSLSEFLSYENIKTNSVVLGAYLGVSKEIKIYKSLSLNMAAQFRYTNKYLSKDRISYTINSENISGTGTAYNFTDRTFLMLGLKYNF
jgi:hypothetical protein